MAKPIVKSSALRKALIIAAYTTGIMYAGDKFDVLKGINSITDKIHGIETADSFASYNSLDLVTHVNHENKRETYLRFEDGDYIQLVPVKSSGYASASLDDRVQNFFSKTKDQINGYGGLDKARDKLSLAINYTRIKIRNLLENIFWGGECNKMITDYCP